MEKKKEERKMKIKRDISLKQIVQFILIYVILIIN